LGITTFYDLSIVSNFLLKAARENNSYLCRKFGENGNDVLIERLRQETGKFL
jgi:hypothetical protein